MVMPPDETWYSDRGNWHGSYLEVAIDLGPPNDDWLRAAFKAAWSSSHLHGPLASPYGDAAHDLDERSTDAEGSSHSYGTLELPGSAGPIGCDVFSVRDDHSDWLDIALPTGMLELIYHVEYPLMHETNLWMPAVERRLVDIADDVYAEVPFDLAIVGEEASGLYFAEHPDPAAAVTREEVDRLGGFLLSPDLFRRLNPSTQAERLRSGLLWIPPSDYASQA